MLTTVKPREKSVRDLTARLFAGFSGARLRAATAGLLRANPHLTDEGAVKEGTIVVLPVDIAVREETPVKQALVQLEKLAADYNAMLTNNIDLARQERTDAMALLRSADFTGLRADERLKPFFDGIDETVQARGAELKELSKLVRDLRRQSAEDLDELSRQIS
jgi:phage tail protein X